MEKRNLRLRPKPVLSIGTPADDLNSLRSLIEKKKKNKGGDPVTKLGRSRKRKGGESGNKDTNKADEDVGVGESGAKKAKRSSTKVKIKRRTTHYTSYKRSKKILQKRKTPIKVKVNVKDKVHAAELGLALQPYSDDLEDVNHQTEKRYAIGDVVSMIDEEDNKYFAQIMRFHQDQNLNFFVSIRWLLPKSIFFGTLSSSIFKYFDPIFFEPGPIHDSRISIQTVQFEMNDPY